MVYCQMCVPLLDGGILWLAKEDKIGKVSNIYAIISFISVSNPNKMYSFVFNAIFN